MEKVSLKDFVAETLASISDGVRAAQEHSKETDGVPIAPHSVDGQKLSIGDQLVKFRVVVEVSSEKGGTGKGQLGGTFLSVVAGSVDGEVNKQARDASQQSIEFSIPMHFHLRYAAGPKSAEE